MAVGVDVVFMNTPPHQEPEYPAEAEDDEKAEGFDGHGPGINVAKIFIPLLAYL